MVDSPGAGNLLPSGQPQVNLEISRADRILLLAFAAANAVLYSSLMPLWEGFDEAFHYDYVQQLSASHHFPVLGKACISQEVWDSMHDCPVSHVTQRTKSELETFDRYFALSPEARTAKRQALESLPRNQTIPSWVPNYEAHQAPLAYVLMAPLDSILSRRPITIRVLGLRILGALAGAIITFIAALYLFRILELPAIYQALGLFCIFACQMYWATTAHVANDWLAVPLSVWFFASVAAFEKKRTLANTLRMALATSLGLLAKAYFLPLAVFAVCLVAYRRWKAMPAFIGVLAALAGPWYIRNLVLYHTLSATVESVAGVGPTQVLASATHVHWLSSILFMLRGALWTGNASFTSFSSLTLNAALLLLAAGMIMAIRRGVPGALWAAVAVYAAAVLYVTGIQFIFQHGEAAGASPWYLEVLLAPVLAIALAGMNRLLAIATAILSGYICIVSYLVKLIPLYGGYPKGRTTLKDVFEWYRSDHGALTSMLSTISLAPPVILYSGTALVVLLSVVIVVRIVRAQLVGVR